MMMMMMMMMVGDQVGPSRAAGRFGRFDQVVVAPHHRQRVPTQLEVGKPHASVTRSRSQLFPLDVDGFLSSNSASSLDRRRLLESGELTDLPPSQLLLLTLHHVT